MFTELSQCFRLQFTEDPEAEKAEKALNPEELSLENTQGSGKSNNN